MRSSFRLLPLVLLMIGCPPPPAVMDGGAGGGSAGGGSGGGAGFDAGCDGRIGCACVAGACTAGECVAGTCTDCLRGEQACVCRSNGTCNAGLRCDAMNLCETCPAGANGCPCGSGNSCDANLMCAAGTCIPTSCVDGAAGCSCRALDPRCDGTAYCDGTQRCQTCSPDVLGCPCNGAGQCLGGLTCNVPTTTCRNPRRCADLADAGTCKPNQACNDAAGADGMCVPGQCTVNPDGGFKWDSTSMTCVPCETPGCSMEPSCAPDAGFAMSCANAHRTCMQVGTVSTCGSCLPGYSPDTNNDCVALPTCGDAGVCGMGQFCDVTTSTCVNSTCPAGQAQFIGSPPPACTMPCSGHCSSCCTSPCTNNCGECKITCSGPGLSGRIWPKRTDTGNCVCETLDGWYWEAGGGGLQVRCDDDNDGWVRDEAANQTNAALVANARCNVRSVDRVRLVDEFGGFKDVVSCLSGLTEALSDGGAPCGAITPLRLLESALNDVTTGAGPSTQFPVYGPAASARRLAPWELSPLTKACVDTGADYDDHSLEDHKEVQAATPLLETDRLRSFAYFVELYTSWFEPVESPLRGRLVIRERSRCGATFPLRYDMNNAYDEGNSSTYWRNCERGRDPSWSAGATATPGFDFARFSPAGVLPPAHASLVGPTDPTTSLMRDHGLCELAGGAPRDGLWRGMNHHSQFKCITVTNSTSPQAWQRPTGDIGLANGKLTFNECMVPACGTGNCSSPPNDGGLLQTGVAPIVCTASQESGVMLLGRTGFAAVNYRGYGIDGGFTATWTDGGLATTYAGGCVNEDTEYGSYLCPYPEYSMSRTGDISFGRYSCWGTLANFLWCDTPCANPPPRATFHWDHFNNSELR